MEDRIKDLTSRVDAVLAYMEEHPESDPNAYEMMDLTIEVGNVGGDVRILGERKNEGNIPAGYQYAMKHEALSNLRSKYFSMMDKRLRSMEVDSNGLGLSEDSMLYRFLATTRDNMITYNRITATGDSEAKDTKCKLAGVALYIKQRRRDLQRDGKEEVIYDNSSELEQIQEYYRVHKPSLHEAGLLDEIERCYGKKFEPKQTGIQGLEKLVKSDEEVVQSYGPETSVAHISRKVGDKDIQQ